MKTFAKIGACATLVSAIVAGGAAAAHAHGYVGNDVSDVVSRAALKSNVDLGPIQYEPQSIEGPKGFSLDPSTGGPADGKIASAGSANAANLDQQSSTRWVKNDVNVGQTVSIGWKYTAAHKTSQWHYYITKDGWNQNGALTRAQLQPLATVAHDGSAPNQDEAHKMTLPANHNGYHVIIAVWDVADTTNAFYSTIDLNIDGEGAVDPEVPETPDPEVPETPDPEVPEVDTEAPSIPTFVHSMNTTHNSVDLMWTESIDNVGVERYEIMRATADGSFQKVATSTQASYLDKGLSAATQYRYQVVAADAAGNKSEVSDVFTVTTKDAPIVGEDDWNPNASYIKGAIVTHEGDRYEAVQTHSGFGDPNWIDAPSLWKKLS